MRITIALVLLLAPLGFIDAQEPDSAPGRAVLLRVAVGSLNPDDPFTTTLAYAVSAGVEWGGRKALLLRVVRQSSNRSFGFDVKERARTFITIDGEIARWPFAPHEQQIRLRLGLGVLLRPGPDPTAFVTSGGVSIRYEIARRLSFVGQLEDDFGRLPRKDYQGCGTASSGTYGAGATCEAIVTGGGWQHNFGLIVALEYRR